jgi:hypothetical protein
VHDLLDLFGCPWRESYWFKAVSHGSKRRGYPAL